MRPLHLLLSLACVSIGLSQDTGLASVIASIPSCAQTCLATAIKASPCRFTDQACVCSNAQLQSQAEVCILQSCTMRQSLTAKNITATFCGLPLRYKGESVRVGNICLSVASAVCALARVIFKAVFSAADLGWDDYSMLVALITGVPSVITIDRGLIPNGFGRDVWTVPFDHITTFVRYLYALEVLYFLQIACLKATLLFFFLRIFPKPIIRKLLWATVIFNVLWGTSFVITAIFQCHPISSYWTSWDREGRRQCVNINALAWSNAIISVVLDFWMLGLPLYEVFQLQLSWRKKLSVAFMFFVGTFVTVVSCLRLQSLVHFATSNNPTWDQVEVVRWSNIEINIGIVCACLPAIRVILVRMFPTILGSSRTTSNHAYANYGSHGITGGGSALRSVNRNKSQTTNDSNTITYTKTFAVQSAENDETSLVQLDDFGGKTSTKVRSSNTSVVSL